MVNNSVERTSSLDFLERITREFMIWIHVRAGYPEQAMKDFYQELDGLNQDSQTAYKRARNEIDKKLLASKK